jgi:Family of unknown function (DUF6062)
MSRMSGIDKSFTYFALLEVFGKSGCPVCRLMEEYSLSYLDALFYEQVNDVGTRRKLREARGFCNWHAWQAKKIAGSALGVAIIAKELLREEITRMDHLLHGPCFRTTERAFGRGIAANSLVGFIQSRRQKRLCPACEVILEHERHALETILNFQDDAEFARPFENSAGLCVIHTSRAAEGNGAHPHLHRLIEVQRRKYTDLTGELEEFCRKHDYRFSHESWGAESDSWLRAIEFLVGKPNIFGNEVHQKGSGRSTIRRWTLLIDRCLQWVLGQGRDHSHGDE